MLMELNVMLENGVTEVNVLSLIILYNSMAAGVNGKCNSHIMRFLKKFSNHCINFYRFGQCTRSCGGGIQWYARECNSPVPKNGGRYCIGRHRTYKSCNTQDCPVDMIDFRDQQCIAMNNRTNSWRVAYNVYAKDQCKLACKNKYTNQISWLKQKVRESKAFR